jgi:endogenous inhibitor of DNA gyrase (YacG/DUF329 family)
MIRYTCPTCGRVFEVATRDEAPCRPFCCERCQRIDLGRWFNEEYLVSDPLDDPNRDFTATDAPVDSPDERPDV